MPNYFTIERRKEHDYRNCEFNFKRVKVEECEDEIYGSPNCQTVFEEREDRISSLPNKILCHILSFLPTKYAVGTCILSTRWKHLWTSIPNLDFDDELLLHRDRSNRASTREMQVSFTSFVDRVLILRNVASIKRFCLKCGQNCDSPHVNTWICSALWRNVQELDLSITNKDSKVLPHGLFTCETLVSLKLATSSILDVPTYVNLPRLKTLHLNSVEFPDDDSMKYLISGCPVLQELHIEECGLKNIRMFNISAPELKRLTIECAFMGEYNTEHCNYKIVIDAPSLEYITLFDYVAEGYSVMNLESLIEAHIHVDLSSKSLGERKHIYWKNVLDLIRGISDVKVLHLSGDCMEALGLYCHLLPTFHNVTHLELDVNNQIGWKLLADILDRSPNLVSLYFWRGLLCCGGFQLVPSCLLLRLKTVKFLAFEGKKYELELVKYLLKNARVLHKLIIGTDMGKEDELKVSKKLLKFSRRSRKCKIVFS